MDVYLFSFWVFVFGFSLFCFLFFLMRKLLVKSEPYGTRASTHIEFYEIISPLVEGSRSVGIMFLHLMRTKEIKDLEKLLSEAGLRREMDPAEFMVLRVFASLAGGLFGCLFGLVGLGVNLFTLLSLFFFMIMGWLYPLMWLKNQATSRHERIFKGLSDTLDILSISVMAGLELRDALERVVSIGSEPELDYEIRQTLQTINQGGKSLKEAFTDLSSRIGIPEMMAFCNVIILAFNLGSGGVGNLLSEQAAAIRNERILRVEKRVAEMPAKILFPIAVFIFPAVLITILGPMALKTYLMFGIGR